MEPDRGGVIVTLTVTVWPAATFCGSLNVLLESQVARIAAPPADVAKWRLKSTSELPAEGHACVPLLVIYTENVWDLPTAQVVGT